MVELALLATTQHVLIEQMQMKPFCIVHFFIHHVLINLFDLPDGDISQFDS
ncbi:hypothetical protein P4S72_03470 [Vibrio sp. PP-XX7]